MSNKEQLQENNTALAGYITRVNAAKETAANLPEAGSGVSFTTDETLSFVGGVLGVNTAKSVEDDNTLPITSAAVATTVGNIEVLLKTI